MSEILSYCFRDLNGNTIHSKEPEVSLIPASNMKILSGYASYKLLGRDHTIKTTISREGDRLIFDGGPTPLLNMQDFANIMKSVPDVDKVKEIVFNTAIFDSHSYAPGWAIGDVGYCYQTPVMPLSVDEGCYSSSKKPKDGALHDYADKAVNDQFSNVSGIASSIIHKQLNHSTKENGVGTVIFEHEETIVDILSHIETYSCNFSIEALVKYLAHVKGGKKGSWPEASRIVKKFASSIGLETAQISISDGSGLSRSNLLTASFLSQLTVKIIENGDMDFIKLLPTPGVGTLKSRFSSYKDSGIHAKTGSLGQVASLSGYIESKKTSFSVIINNSLRGEKALKRTIDEIVGSYIDGSL